MPDTPICHRCATVLRRGHAELYIVRIEAFADPEIADPGPLALEDIEAEYAKALADATERSPQELMDDVHRRLTITLCNDCYRAWIENPTG